MSLFDLDAYTDDFFNDFDGELEPMAEEGFAIDNGFPAEIFYTADDPDVCSICEPFHGEIYRTGDGPEPPLHNNCRCWKIYLI